MAKTDNLTDFLTNTANAIRMAEGSTAAINPQDFEAKITALKLSVQTADANATSADILSGKTAWVNGTKISGSIGTKAATTIIPGTSDQTISSGVYLAGAQTIKGDSNLTADNIKSGTSIFGVTGTYGGSTPNLQSKSVTYTANGTATITPDGGYDGLSSVDVTVNVASGGGGGDTSETWVIKSDAAGEFATTQIAFTSNGQKFTSIGTNRDDGPIVLYYDNTEIAGYEPGTETRYTFNNEAYRKLTFDTPPTGALLTWLQSNGIKQPDDTAVQDTKALTITSNGTVSVTPDAPYDGLSSVDVTVDVASGGGGGAGFSVTFPATAVAWDSAAAGCVIVQADGTVVNMQNYSTLAGKTIHNVIEIGMCGNGFYYPRMTVQTGKILFTNVAAFSSQIRILVNGESSGISLGNGSSARWIPLADTVISKLEMYNTD